MSSGQKKFATVEASKIALISAISVALVGVITASITAYSNYMSNRVQIELPINATQTAEARIIPTSTPPIPDSISIFASNTIQSLVNRNLLSSTSGAVVWENNEIVFRNEILDQIRFITTDSAPTDFVIYSEMIWSSSPDDEFSACGFFFRSDMQFSNYVALTRKNGNSVFWLMYPDVKQSQELESTSINGINKSNESINKQMLIAQGNKFVLLINDTIVYEVVDNALATGYVGLMAGSGPHGVNTCTFKNSWLWAIR